VYSVQKHSKPDGVFDTLRWSEALQETYLKEKQVSEQEENLEIDAWCAHGCMHDCHRATIFFEVKN
jgi:hypothetical protein